jgi:hypothetical protein
MGCSGLAFPSSSNQQPPWHSNGKFQRRSVHRSAWWPVPTHGVVGPLGWLKVWGLAAQGPLKKLESRLKRIRWPGATKKDAKKFSPKKYYSEQIKKI